MQVTSQFLELVYRMTTKDWRLSTEWFTKKRKSSRLIGPGTRDVLSSLRKDGHSAPSWLYTMSALAMHIWVKQRHISANHLMISAWKEETIRAYSAMNVGGDSWADQKCDLWDFLHVENRMDSLVVWSVYFDIIRLVDNSACYKSRLIAVKYRVDESGTIAQEPRPVTDFFQERVLSKVASLDYTGTQTRNTTQSYTQCDNCLENDACIRPLEEMKFPARVMLKLIILLYGILESGLEWYLTYVGQHADNISMRHLWVNSSLRYQRKNGMVSAMSILQVYDCFIGSVRRLYSERQWKFEESFL